MADSEESPKRAAVVFNPIKVDVKKLKAAVAVQEKEAGWGKTIWLSTTEQDPGLGQARQALAKGAAVVLAAGGDGTVRSVGQVLRGTGVPLALLPAGTGNVLARNLGLSLRLDDAVKTAFSGDDRAIDLGVIQIERQGGAREEHVFLALAGLGLDAKMVANTRPELKKRVGWLAYVDAIARSMRDSEKIRMRYRLGDAEEKTMNVHTILVGNCGLLPGNVLLLPEAEIDDGVFDIVTLRPEGLGGWAVIWAKIVWENGVLRRSQVGRKVMSMQREVRTLRYFKGEKISLRLDQPEDFELDGDDFGLVMGFTARVDPLSLTVRVPAS